MNISGINLPELFAQLFLIFDFDQAVNIRYSMGRL